MCKELSDKQKRKLENDLKEKSQRVSREDVERLMSKKETIFEKAAKLPSQLMEDVKLLWSALCDYWNNEYTEIPWVSIAAIGTGLLYLINPFDLVLDAIPLIGYIDDIFVLEIIYKSIKSDFDKYKKWKLDQDD